MNSIGPGDWVECIDDYGITPPLNLLTRGKLYRVFRVEATPNKPCRYIHDCMDGGLILYDVPTSQSYCVHRFRPVHRPSDELFQQLLLPLPKDDLELV
jgi:hypothetical protein